MRKSLAAAALGATLVAAGAVGVPAVASAAGAESAGTAVSRRLDALTDALSGLVRDGTLTRQQADKVATTLEKELPKRHVVRGGPWMRTGVSLDAAADALGMTRAELRTSVRNGQTLAQLAAAKKVPVTTVIDALVTAAEKRLARAVSSGRLTSAESDQRRETLRERMTELVNEGFPRARHGRPGGRGAPGPGTSPAPAPSPSPTS